MKQKQSAVGKRLADTEAFERRFAIARGRLLNEEVLEINKRALVTKAAMRKYYNDNWHDERTEMSFRHILVETEAEAKAIIAKLKKGANFVDLAETNSKDLETADKGGFLGYFVMDEYPIRELEQTMSKLKVGQVSDPVKSSEGWHVVTADKKLVKPKSKFEDKNVQDEIRYYLSDQVEREWSDKLRRQVEAAITYLNSGKSD